MFAPSLAAPVKEEQAEAVLQAIRMLLVSESDARSAEVEQAELEGATNPPTTSTPSGQPPNATSNG